MLTPKDARRYIESTNASYGDDVDLPFDIDTSECQEFFGTRCPNNVHVKNPRLAHVDREDPRKNPIGHLKKDVGVPYAAMTASVGAAIGASLAKGNRKKGAIIGGLLGIIPGVIVDVLESKYYDRPKRDFVI